jgi:hypothetical protein
LDLANGNSALGITHASSLTPVRDGLQVQEHGPLSETTGRKALLSTPKNQATFEELSGSERASDFRVSKGNRKSPKLTSAPSNNLRNQPASSQDSAVPI